MAVMAPAPTRDLHSFLEQFEREFPDEVIHLETPIDSAWELTALVAKLERAKRFPVVVCHKVLVDGQLSSTPVLLCLMASRRRIAWGLGTDVHNAGLLCYERVRRRFPAEVVSRESAPVKGVVQKGAEVDVRRFPAPLHHSTDPGRYITAGFFLTYSRETRQDNSALHRGWLAGPDEVRVSIGATSNNAYILRQYQQAREDAPAAFWIGHHPLAIIGAETHVGLDESCYETAGGALGSALRLVPSETLGEDFLVPAEAEVVIEGYVPWDQRKPEGPFGEYTRHNGPQRWGHVLKVTAVTCRRDAYWDDVMVGHTHWISSLAKEGALLRDLRRVVPGVRAVHVPMSGCGVAHVYIQLRKTVEGQGKAVAAAALMDSSSIKHAFVFDEDVDIFNEKEVLQALAMRLQADRGLFRIDGATGSPLDPSSLDGRTTSKLGFDCTKPVGRPFAERLSVPEAVLKRIDPVAILGREQFDRLPAEPWG